MATSKSKRVGFNTLHREAAEAFAASRRDGVVCSIHEVSVGNRKWFQVQCWFK